ncbi:MAG: oligosaccharide flippase family protein [Candidatus Magasanikbacteria bacterium]|nr:oligosaccharide flippase family protein [Candidatus Magasanikbacteria bacterium]
MSLARTIAHNTAIQIIGKAASTLLGLMAVAIMTRSLGAEHFGWYITASGFLQFIGIVSDFGFTVTVSNMLAEGMYDKRAILNTTLTWRLITAALFNGAAPLIILFFPYPPEIKLAVAILAVSFFVTALNQVFIGYYRERLQLMTATVGEVVGRVVLVIGVGGVALGRFGFLPIMTIITAAAIATTGYLWLHLRPIHFSLDRAVSRALLHKMWPTAISVICNAFYLQADRVILPLYTAQTVVGLYGASYRVLDVVIQIAALIMGMIMPLITFAWARNNLAEFKQRYQLGFDALVLVLMPMIVGIFVLSRPILRLIAGSSFLEGGDYLRYLSLSIFGTCFGMIFGHIALAINRQKEALWIYGTDAVLSLAGYFYFISHYGVWGAIGVTLFSEVYAGLGLTILTIYYSGVTPRLTSFFKILLASLIMGATLYAVPKMPLFGALALGATVYIGFIMLLRVISPATLKEIITTPEVAEIS